MKRFLVAVLVLAGCARIDSAYTPLHPAAAATDPAQVLIFRELPTSLHYTVLGKIETIAGEGVGSEDAHVKILRQKASEVGAKGIVLIAHESETYGSTTTGTVSGNYGLAVTRPIGSHGYTALAITW